MLEQSNAAGTSGSRPGWVLTLYFCCGCTTFADDGLLLRPSGLAAKSASEMPVIPTNSPNKTRRLKNPPSLKLRWIGVDFFFMRVSGYEVDGVQSRISRMFMKNLNCGLRVFSRSVFCKGFFYSCYFCYSL